MTLALYDPQSALLKSAGNTNTGSYLHHTAAATGSYFLSTTQGTAPGSYTLAAATVADDFANNAATTGTIAVNGTASGAWEGPGDADWFAVTLTQGVTYRLVDVAGGAALGIRNAQGAALTGLNGSPDLSFTPLTSGTYYVEALGFSGGYTFGINAVADDNGETSATFGALRVTVNGTANPDTLTSTAEYEVINGQNGDDLLIAGGGFDIFNGGAGVDTLTYAGFGQAVDVSLLLGRTLVGGVLYDAVQQVENLVGTAFNDTLTGNNANNLIDGGAGADAMAGGLGDDIYLADNGGDTVTEAAGQGTDEVRTALATYSIAAFANVERLTGTSAGGQALTGNSLDNVIAGNAGSDLLDGGAGADALAGGAGNDFYVIDNAGDSVAELLGEGSDYVFARTSWTLTAGAQVETVSTESHAALAAIDLTGNALANTLLGNDGVNRLEGGGGGDRLLGLGGADVLIGGAAADLLEGGAGNDLMEGRGGDDVYVVEDAADAIVEAAAEGLDYVRARASWTLNAGAEVETVSTESHAALTAIDLTGNALANTLIGNAGVNRLEGGGGTDRLLGLGGADVLIGGASADLLDGGTGNDLMEGRGGDDVYVVEDADDAIVELAGGGVDYVRARASWTLNAGAEVETLSTESHAALTAIDLTGNERDNTLIGNDGNNSLNGGGGADRLIGLGGADNLTGGEGADLFMFVSALGGGVDNILDMNVGVDRIALDRAVFVGLAPGALLAGAFRNGLVAQDADDRILYDSNTGALFFDADGNGAGAALQFATVTAGLPLTASDFVVI